MLTYRSSRPFPVGSVGRSPVSVAPGEGLRYDGRISAILSRIKELVAAGELRISDDGYDELAADGLFARAPDGRLSRIKKMSAKKSIKLLHEGRYAAEVEVELVESGTGWSPCLGIADAYKLDEVRVALQRGDLRRAAALARVYEMIPIAV